MSYNKAIVWDCLPSAPLRFVRPTLRCWSYEAFLSETSKVMAKQFPYQDAKRMLLNPLGEKGILSKVVLNGLSAVLDKKFTRYA